MSPVRSDSAPALSRRPIARAARLRIERTIGVLALLNILMIGVLLGHSWFSNASLPPRGISDPIVALEVARNVDEVDAVLGDAPSPDRETMRLKQYVDFGFIGCYAALFLALGRLLSRTLPPEAPRWVRPVAIAAVVCGIAAAGFDVMENLAILRLLDVDLRHTTQAMVDAIRLPGIAKWSLTFVALALLSSGFLSRRGWMIRLVGAAEGITAAMGFFGLYDNAALVWVGIPMIASLAGLAVLFFPAGRR
jgi:hypothetical protein